MLLSVCKNVFGSINHFPIHIRTDIETCFCQILNEYVVSMNSYELKLIITPVLGKGRGRESGDLGGSGKLLVPPK